MRCDREAADQGLYALATSPEIQNTVLKFPTNGPNKRTSTVLINGPEDKIPPPTVGKFRTVTKLTVRKFRTLLLVNQGRPVVWGCSWAGAVCVAGGGTA